MIRFTAPLAACLLAFPLAAQDGTGSVTGTLDLDPARWVVVSGGDGPTSRWSESGDGSEIRLVATPEPGSEDGPGTLTIEMSVAAGAVEAQATDVRVMLERGDGSLIAGSEDVDLSLTAYQPAAGELALAGSFVATMIPGTVPRSVDADAPLPEDGVALDGNFQATIRGPASSLAPILPES